MKAIIAFQVNSRRYLFIVCKRVAVLFSRNDSTTYTNCVDRGEIENLQQLGHRVDILHFAKSQRLYCIFNRWQNWKCKNQNSSVRHRNAGFVLVLLFSSVLHQLRIWSDADFDKIANYRCRKSTDSQLCHDQCLSHHIHPLYVEVWGLGDIPEILGIR